MNEAVDPKKTPEKLALMLIFALPAVIACHPLANNDLPMHLAIGDYILDSGSIPAADPFAFTPAPGSWVPHEWLAGVLFSGVERSIGAIGLSVLLIVGTLLLVLCHRAAMGALGVSAGAHLAWLVPLWLLAGPRLLLRPHLFSLALPFILWWILLRARRHAGFLFLLPVVMAVWVNLHGSFLLGYGIIALDFLVGDKEHSGSWARRAAALAGAIAALLAQVHVYAQPDFLAALKHPFELVRDPVFMSAIQEWQAPFAAATGFRSEIAFALSLPWMAAALYGVWRNRNVPLSYRIFVVVTLLLYLKHQRFVGLFALASLPVLPSLARLSAPQLRARIARAAAIVAGLLFLWPGFPVAWNRPLRPAGFGWNTSYLPFAQVDRIAENELRGPVYCEYEFGGLIAWRTGGRAQISMDSRNSVYGADLFRVHHNSLFVDSTPNARGPDVDAARAFRERMLDECYIALVHSPTHDPWRRGLHNVLVEDPRWRNISVIETVNGVTRIPASSLWVRVAKPKQD